MRTFWWRPRSGFRNFGDELAPLLLKAFAGIDAEWSPAGESQVVAVGSIATMLPRQYTGAVLGIGVARETPIDLSRADVRALRGPLTARAAGVTQPVALGDPGLLVSLLYDERPDTTYAIGVVPHWQDHDLAVREWDQHDALLIDVRRPPLEVIAAIASCERIVSSSLHGLVIADSFGIPRQWAWFDRVQGNGFKFADYHQAIDQRGAGPGGFLTPNRRVIEQRQSDLREAYGQWASYQHGDYV